MNTLHINELHTLKRLIVYYMNFASTKENVVNIYHTPYTIHGHSPCTWVKVMDKSFLLGILKKRQGQRPESASQHGLFLVRVLRENLKEALSEQTPQ